ncbi:hypothetical protein [Vibrio comitans]|nr:hypothetical protein [Vibrio comitans]
MVKLISGATLFLGYALFSASMKLGDFFITAGSLGVDSVTTLSNGLTILIACKLFSTIIGCVILNKVDSFSAFKVGTLMFTAGVAIVGVGIGGLAFSEHMLSKAFIGLGGGFILATINPLTAMLFQEKELSIVSGANNAAPNIGITALIVSASLIMTQLHLPMYLFVGIALLLVLTMLGLRTKAKPIRRDNAPSSGVLNGVKSLFNLIFAAAFSAVVAFFTLCFTFLEPAMVTPFLLAAIAGSFVGTGLATICNYRVVAISASLVGAVGAVIFISSGNAYAGMICGFSLFSSVTSYMMLAFKREGVTPASLSITFMLLWVFNDLFVLVTGAVYGRLSATDGATLLIVFAVIYPLLTLILVTGKQKNVELIPINHS